MKIKSYWKKATNKQKNLLTTIVVASLLGGGTACYLYSVKQENSREVAQADTLVNKTSEELKQIEKEITKLYSEKNPEFLNSHTTDVSIYTVQKKIQKVRHEYNKEKKALFTIGKEQENKTSQQFLSCEKALEAVQSMLLVQKDVNSLFEKPVITGDSYTKNVPLKATIQSDNVNAMKNKYYDEVSHSKWQQAINELLKEAETQAKQIDKAKTVVKEVFKDNKVVQVDKKKYDTALVEVKKIKNETVRKQLLEQLDKVKVELEKQAKKETETNEKSTEIVNTETNQNITPETKQEGTENPVIEDVTENVSQETVVSPENTLTPVPNTPVEAPANQSVPSVPSHTDNGVSAPPVAPPSSGNNTDGGSVTPPSNGNNESSNGGQTTPPPVEQAQKWVGWWNDGKQLHSAGVFDTEEEALAAGKALCMQNGGIGTWGATQT
ncbi:hypothetical protein [Enterococcus faecalis]|uniref:hypothetical protein n=1 Tax=Enterococcus faecalis TaxID=1351 RepID=UPI0025AFB4B7|nr:hypothetical protein [Enterococcus faecalis]MDN3183546.1 hypothetical protein [Enterococcus faecalis]